LARIIVATASPPFAEGGHLVMARELVRALHECGHEAAVVVTPQNRFGRQGAAYLAAWFTDVEVAHEGRVIDQVISLRFPAYVVRHPRHVVWLNHRMREYYDLWPELSAHLSWKGKIKEGTRRAIVHRVDKHFLNKAQRRFVISATIKARLQRWGGIESEVLYPPPPARDYRCDAYDDYLFAVSRLTPHKRFDLLLRALAEPVAASIRCLIAGEGTQLKELLRLRGNLGLEDRVEFVGRVDDEELMHLLGRCRAVVFPPVNEDYGIVTVESFMCAKPVITCRDSGGVAELVRDGENGFVCDPAPESLARALRAVIDDKNLAIRLGEAGQRDASRMTWAEAINRLVLPR
jgi:glycosyltransferase involved in cell wall biosynthesis